MSITGTELNYLYICPRKLWLFRHGIRPEAESELVQLGLLLGESSFERQEKEIPIGEIGVLDWADFKDGVIHETKKGRRPGENDLAQVRYYLWFLNSKGIDAHEAVIHYPECRKTVTLTWNDSVEAQVLADLAACEKVIEGSLPEAVKNRCCRKCAYEEYCWI